MPQQWCGYIDMIGTRSIAQRNTQDLRDSLNNFHSALDDGFERLGAGKCYAFSDGAFFACDSVDEFVQFYRHVRNELFQQKIFFKCSFIRGAIDVNRRGENPSREGRFVSMTFGRDAPLAYQKESEFKGIGCTSQELIPQDFVKSYYVVPVPGGVRATAVVDVAYSDYELSYPTTEAEPLHWRVFDPIVEGCQATIAQSTRVAAYYLTPLVTAVRSMSLKNVEYGDYEWQNAPYAFEEIATGTVSRALRQVPGISFLLLTFFDHLYNEKDGNIPHLIEEQILEVMQKHPACFRRLDEVPDYVISHPARSRLISLHVESERQLERTRRATKIRIARAAAKRATEKKAS